MGEGFGFMKGFKQAGHSIFTHSRHDKIGSPRLLPLDLYKYLSDYRQKKPLKYHALPVLIGLIRREIMWN